METVSNSVSNLVLSMNFLCLHKPLGDLEFEPLWRGGRNRMGEEEGEEEEGAQYS